MRKLYLLVFSRKCDIRCELLSKILKTTRPAHQDIEGTFVNRPQKNWKTDVEIAEAIQDYELYIGLRFTFRSISKKHIDVLPILLAF